MIAPIHLITRRLAKYPNHGRLFESDSQQSSSAAREKTNDLQTDYRFSERAGTNITEES
jgi:hypothetical protein